MFYDKLVYKVEEYEYKNELGQLIKELILSNSFYADVQPTTTNTTGHISGTSWGESLNVTLIMYTDEFFNYGDYVVYKGKTYRVKAVNEWDSYCMCGLEYTEIVVKGLI